MSLRIRQMRVAGLLGSHVIDGPHHRPFLGEGRVLVPFAVVDAGQPQVQHLGDAALRQQDVLRLNVSMHDPLSMGVPQPGRRLGDDRA